MRTSKTIKNCSQEGCESPSVSRGMCRPHYRSFMYHTDPPRLKSPTLKWVGQPCYFDGCSEPAKTVGLCGYHYSHVMYKSSPRGRSVKSRNRTRDYEGSRTCQVPGCDRDEFNPGLCSGHYYQKNRGEDFRPLRQKLPCPVTGCTDVYAVQKNSSGVCSKHSSLEKRFSLTQARLLELHVSPSCSNGGCGSTDNLHLDHDHSCCPESGKSCGSCVRGWLCHKCNVTLGMMGDDLEKLRGLITYLEKKKTPA